MFFTGLFMLLVGSALKDDASGIAMSDFWFELDYGPIINIMKSFSPLLIFTACALFIIDTTRNKVTQIRLSPWAFSWLFLWLYSALRTADLSIQLAIHDLLGHCIDILLFFCLSSRIASTSWESVSRISAKAVISASLLITAVNFYAYYAGYGYVPQNSRFFGATSHPNFIGIQLGVALISIVCVISSSKSTLIRTLFITVTIPLSLMLLATGSRTGLVVAVSGTSLILSRALRIHPLIWTSIVVMSVAIFIISKSLLDLSVYSDSFQRDNLTADTRAVAWQYLLEQIAQSPLFGTAIRGQYVENSYLLGWALYGVIFGIGATLLWIINAIKSTLIANRLDDPLIGLGCFVSISLFIAAFFEPFYLDVHSLPIRCAYIFGFLISIANRETVVTSTRRRKILLNKV